MNVKKYCAFIITALSLLRSEGLPVTDMPTDSLLVSLGQELMAALDVATGDESRFFSCWNYPTSIVVRTIPYRVDIGWRESGCKVYPTNDTAHPVAEVVVTRMSNEKNARLYGFGSLALGCSLPRDSLVRSLSVENLDSATNTLFVSRKRSRSSVGSTFISKNLLVEIRGNTNSVDFAVSLINAGLPEEERIAVPPSP